MLGKTNAASGRGGDGSGGGEIVTAVNKTGKELIAGEKVWLNDNSQKEMSSYSYSFNNSTATQRGMYLTTSGMLGWGFYKVLSLSDEKAVVIENFPSSSTLVYAYNIYYGPENSIFFCYNSQLYRCDDTKRYIQSGDSYIGGNYKIQTINAASHFVKFDLETGENLFNVKVLDVNAAKYIFIDGKIYSLSSPYPYYYTIDEDSSTVHKTSVAFINPTDLYPLGVTKDNKYIIGREYDQGFNNHLRMAERIDDTHIKFLSQDEMPADLQEFYSQKDCSVSFNPNTGILTVAEFRGSGFAIMKYENGLWTKVPVTFDNNYIFQTYITVDNQMTRAMFGNSNSYIRIVNLKAVEGYAAVPYKFYNISENTMMGYAANNAAIDEEVEVNIATKSQ